jgi:hypothetical protein
MRKPMENPGPLDAAAKSWLGRNLIFSKMAVLVGDNPSETRNLIKTWTQEMGSRLEAQYSFGPFKSPQIVLGFEQETSIEDALKTLETRWKPGSMILWEGIHHLSTNSQNLLIHFLRSSGKNAIHFLACEKALGQGDLPTLILQQEKTAISEVSTEIDNEAGTLTADALDSLAATDLQNLEEILLKRIEKNTEVKDLLLLSRCLFLRGQRVQAFETLKSYLLRGTPAKLLLTQSGQELLIESLRLANRNGRFEETQILANLLPATIKLSGNLRAVYELEKILAQEHLKTEVNTNSLDALIERFSQTDNLRFSAEAIFQRARIFDARDEQEKALFDYQRSGTLFRDLDLPYQACTALLNSAWIVADQMKWDALKNLRDEILQLSRRFGYPHIVASLDTIESQRLRLHGQLFEALQLIQKAIEKLESHEAPVLVLTDSVIQRARILLALGQRSRAQESIETYIRRVTSKDKRSLARLQILQREMQSLSSGAAQWLEEESRKSVSNSPETHALLSAERGLLETLSEESRHLERFPVGKLALYQNDLLKALSEHGKKSNEVSTRAEEFQRFADSLPEMICERILAQIIRAELSNEFERPTWIHRAEELLLSSSAEEKTLEGLRTWIEAIKSERIVELFETAAWQKLPLIDRERWEGWIRKLRSELLEAQSKTEYYTIADGKLDQVPSPAQLALFQQDALFVDDRQNIILNRGKNLRSLGKKGILYDLLKTLLQSGTSGVSKDELAALIWGEDYKPPTHDPRIYVAIRRLREIFRDAKIVVQHRGRYLLNPQRPGILIREQRGRSQMLSDTEKKVLLTLKSRVRSKGIREDSLTSRSELQKILNIPEATLKRSLQSLLKKQEIQALGGGRNRKYYL